MNKSQEKLKNINYTRSDQNGITLLQIQDSRLDSRISTLYKQEFLVMKSDGVQQMIVDLSKVSHIDSSGLGALLFGRRLMIESNGDLKILGARASVMNIFKIAHLDRVFDFYDNEGDAVNSYMV